MPPKARVSKTSARGKPQQASKTAKKAATPEDFIEQGNLALSRLEPELAAKFFSAALKLSPSDTNIMDALADVLIQLGDADGAMELLSNSTQMAPSENPVKWLYLAQLKEGEDSLLCYRTAIGMLQDSLLRAEGVGAAPADADVLKKQICRAYCSIAELYLTDLCYDDGAEASCEAAVQDSLRYDGGNLETYQTLASLRLSQCRGQEASELMMRVAQQVLEVRERLHKRSLLAELRGDDDEEAAAAALDVPTVEASTATVKLCLECVSFNSQLASVAAALTNNLLAEDDEVIELWYLLGLASQQLPEPDLRAAAEAFEMARDLLSQILEQIRLECGEDALALPAASSSAGPDQASSEECGGSCAELTEAQFYQQQYTLCTEQLDALAANPAFQQLLQQQENPRGEGAAAPAAVKPMAQAAAGQEDEEWSTEDEMET
jgi:tetratricopeptide (TPR) repeat protein